MLFEADLHTHTIASGHAYSTVKELAEAAEKQGLKMIAITDHGPKMPGGPHEYHFGNLVALPRKIGGVEILRGVEANIIDVDGNLDLPERLLEELDIVLAGFHTGTGFDNRPAEDYTRAVLAAIANPRVHLIVHPGNPDFPVDIEKLVLAAAREHKALEINNNSFSISRQGSLPRCQLLAKLAHKHKVQVVVNSDAHIFSSVGNFARAWQVARSAGISEDQVINKTAGRVKEYLGWHRRRGQALQEAETYNGRTSQEKSEVI
ncbi:MAG: putative hydrolase [Moorella sp. (in: firmicutes)]|uniref:Putative phosphatase YcdX n=1 Tax=Neomoorella thermoacetica TaxID=1525 RepID=A0A1J5NUV1_NEOTH|nr:putative hydrolase [Moorella sp. (in: firmicutes)]OIQ59092.1 putative phosphatase YcdX [Moorella thermoacetica]